jgi:hypothetical protein
MNLYVCFYLCRLLDERLPSPYTLTKLHANVSDIPMARLQLGSSLNPDTIREGTDVYFDCLIQARPSVYKVEWRHNVSMSRYS